jgi:Polyketide cyclase / dehydrase and lipid transport
MIALRLALTASFLFLVSAASANAVEVRKKRDLPGDPDEVWMLIGDFCSIKNWHPAVADCQESNEEGQTFRTLTLKVGGSIKEKLISKDETSYSYQIIEGPLPVKDYTATFVVEKDEDSPERSEIEWEAEFEANGANDEDARKLIGRILEDGVKSIKKLAIAAWDAKHPEESQK